MSIENSPQPAALGRIFDGSREMLAAVETLAAHIPPELRPLARLAYNYWWSWAPGGEQLFRSIDPHRWTRAGENPVRLLQEVSPARFIALAADSAFLARLRDLEARLDAELARPSAATSPLPGPVAFMCAEFGVHATLPVYAGGLGVLAGDVLKECSGLALPLLGIGILYSQGSFHQRLDAAGWQHEYWLETDAERTPAVVVGDANGLPLVVTVPIRGREVAAQVWRVDIGRIPLFLLDTNLPQNSPADRFIGARLYVGDSETRLAQYALLGIGGVRALKAMGLRHALIHLNEGHAALAILELIRDEMAAGNGLEASSEAARRHVIFTTHTPVAAGNDTFSADEMQSVLDDIHAEFGLGWQQFLDLGRVHPGDQYERFGMTPFALRMSCSANGVSARHGETSRRMWHDLWPGRAPEGVPISHITNGVHLPTWMAPPMRELLDRWLGPGWERRAAEPGVWAGINAIPDAELWAVRNVLRKALIDEVRDLSVTDRLGRGGSRAYAESAAELWRDDVITVGFARRIATYKRLYLLTASPERALRILGDPDPMQMIIAGKAHPQDEEAKRTITQLFAMDNLPGIAGRVVFLGEHDIALASRLVRGCDLWINLPRPPLEASGTSGMKSALNGGLQLSVLDGWWAEGYDGANGWAIPAVEGLDAATQDARDAAAVHDLLEFEILPLFYDRGEDGIPHGWVQRIKRSMTTICPRFNTTRMMRQYMERAEDVVAECSAPRGAARS